MKLHIGCGPIRLTDFINIDLRQTAGADIVADITEGLPQYSDGSIEEIYNAHMLEHLTKEDGLKCIKEFHRLLKKGGLLRIEVPELLKVIQRFIDGIVQEDELISNLYGIQRHEGDYHKFAYTLTTLTRLLEQNGFTVQKHEDGRTGYKNSPGIKVWAMKN